MVAHSGTAAFYRLGDHQELTGTSPIVIHRLMKNSVQASEYMLFTEPAYRDLASPDWKVEEVEERYDDIGTIKSYVYYPLLSAAAGAIRSVAKFKTAGCIYRYPAQRGVPRILPGGPEPRIGLSFPYWQAPCSHARVQRPLA